MAITQLLAQTELMARLAMPAALMVVLEIHLAQALVALASLETLHFLVEPLVQTTLTHF
jgi:hypothetical protein